VERYLGNVLAVMIRSDESKTSSLWKQSGLSFNDLGIFDAEKFCTLHGLSCLATPMTNGVLEPAMQSLSSLLAEVASSTEPSPSLNPVFDHITANYSDTKDNAFIRSLTQTLIQACLSGLETSVQLNPERLQRLAGVLKPYLDAVKEREVQALYALQALVHRLEHPNKLLHSIFDILYEIELISEDAFIEWEESTEPGEQEGKGVALKSCTQFFQWLKTAEPEDEPEEPQKAMFTIGDGKEMNESDRNVAIKE